MNAAAAGELVVGDRSPDLAELQSLVRQTKILHDCTLLQELKIIPSQEEPGQEEPEPKKSTKKAKQFMLSLVETQQMLGRSILEDNMLNFDMRLDEETINQLIDELVEEQKIQILDPDNNRAGQFILWLPE